MKFRPIFSLNAVARVLCASLGSLIYTDQKKKFPWHPPFNLHQLSVTAHRLFSSVRFWVLTSRAVTHLQSAMSTRPDRRPAPINPISFRRVMKVNGVTEETDNDAIDYADAAQLNNRQLAFYKIFIHSSFLCLCRSIFAVWVKMDVITILIKSWFRPFSLKTEKIGLHDHNKIEWINISSHKLSPLNIDNELWLCLWQDCDWVSCLG